MLRSMRPQGHFGHLSDAEIAEMRARRASGQTVAQIADEMGCSYTTASRRTKDTVVTAAPASPERGRRGPPITRPEGGSPRYIQGDPPSASLTLTPADPHQHGAEQRKAEIQPGGERRDQAQHADTERGRMGR